MLIVAVIGLKAISTFPKQKQQPQVTQPQSETLRVVSTNPNPLENATILATQDIEITLSKPVFIGQIKIQFSPDLEYKIEPVNPVKANTSSVYKITFKKPLELGSGYTFFIQGGTQTEDGQKIDQEYSYHFKTVKYKGV